MKKRNKSYKIEKNDLKANKLNKDIVNYIVEKKKLSSKFYYIKEKQKSYLVKQKDKIKNEKDNQKIDKNKNKKIEKNFNIETTSVTSDDQFNRYYYKTNTKCDNCNERGHRYKNCLKKKKCLYCLEKHIKYKCPTVFFCFFCQKDHHKNNCKLRKKKKCRNCNKPGHEKKECNYLNRRMGLIKIDDPNIKCIVCQKYGHLKCDFKKYKKIENLKRNFFKKNDYKNIKELNLGFKISNIIEIRTDESEEEKNINLKNNYSKNEKKKLIEKSKEKKLKNKNYSSEEEIIFKDVDFVFNKKKNKKYRVYNKNFDIYKNKRIKINKNSSFLKKEDEISEKSKTNGFKNIKKSFPKKFQISFKLD